MTEGKNPDWQKSKVMYNVAKKVFENEYKLNAKETEELIRNCDVALKQKEYWFILNSARKIQENESLKKYSEMAEVLELDAMISLFQYRPALKKAEELKKKYKKNKRVIDLQKALQKYMKEDAEDDTIDFELLRHEDVGRKETMKKPVKENKRNYRYDAVYYPNKDADFVSVKMFDVVEDSEKGIKRYFRMFNQEYVKHIGAEIIFNNPFYELENREYECKVLWYVNDFIIGKNDFQLKVNREWDAVIFAPNLVW